MQRGSSSLPNLTEFLMKTLPTCELCGPIVKRALSNVSGVLAVDVSEATDGAIAKVRFDDGKTNVAALITATTNAGYPSKVSQ